MLHLESNSDEIFNKKFPICSVPKSLRAFVIHNTANIEISPFFVELVCGLECLTLVFISHKELSAFSFLSHCRNLVNLRMFHGGDIDFSFLRSLPQLRYLAAFSPGGMRVEDCVVVSREAPNLDSLSLIFTFRDFSCDYFESLGRELCFLKTLTFFADKRIFKRFLEVFLSNHSLFPRVTSLRCVSRQESQGLNLSNERRPQCTISHRKGIIDSCSRDQFCYICHERQTPKWTCSRCQCFMFALG